MIESNGVSLTLFGEEPVLFEAPALQPREQAVLDEIDELRRSLRHQLFEPRRWAGSLRRQTFARNIQGSNSIEGYDARLDDAAAVALGEEPLDADAETRLALAGYRNAMTYVLQMVQDPGLRVSEDVVKSLHFMMTSYDLSIRPGRWRAGPIFVQKEQTKEIVHEGADVALVPDLMRALTSTISAGSEQHPVVRAAMAHLNLVMIHPFKDGNGRMARCLQSLILASDGVLAPVFMSIEEYLGRNTQEYYDVLAAVGGGSWQPQRSARAWVRFILTAHLKQALTLQRRIKDSEQIWSALEQFTSQYGLPERVIGVLFDATSGFRVRNATYRAALLDSEEAISEQTASRDLGKLVEFGLLESRGQKRGRYYERAAPLEKIWQDVLARRDAKDRTDPFADAPPLR